MAYIAGLTDALKYSLKEYCRDHRITQVDWVAIHLDADLAKDAEPITDKREEAAN